MALVLQYVRLLVTRKLEFRGITEVRGALLRYHGNNTSEKMEANKDIPLFTNIFTLQESSLPILPSHGLFHCKLVLNTNNSVYFYDLLKKYTKCLHQGKP